MAEHWILVPEEEAGRFYKNAHPLKAMMDPPVPCAALERKRQPALVLWSPLCCATAHTFPSPAHFGEPSLLQVLDEEVQR